jgi:hypothetical protein
VAMRFISASVPTIQFSVVLTSFYFVGFADSGESAVHLGVRKDGERHFNVKKERPTSIQVQYASR